MEELAPSPVQPSPVEQDCTATLRPFPTKAQADAAVTTIRNRGRLIVGLDIGSNLLSFRDPITGEITGFDVDIAGEVARDIFGTPSQVEYRILSSADRIRAGPAHRRPPPLVRRVRRHLDRAVCSWELHCSP